jgi:D-xylose transport system permease protein
MSVVIALVFAIMVFYHGIPYAILIVMAMVLIFSFVSQNMTFGRYVYAIGGNRDAAQLSGINVKKTNFLIFVLQGLAVAIAGIVYTSRLNAATGGAGSGMELDVIAACIIGGTSTMGGEGTVFGAIIGALVMASLDNGMSLMNLGVVYQYVVKGIVLLIAVAVDVSTRKKQ